MHPRRRTCIESLEKRVLLAAAADIPITMIDGMPIATVQWHGESREMFAGRWIVQLDGYQGNLFAQEAQAQQAIAATSRAFTVVRHMAADGMFLVQAPQQMAVADVVQTLSAVPGFRWAGPDFRYELQLTPNDSSFGSLWGLHNTGQSGGTVDADIDAPEAWDISTGSSSVVVGMVDSGIDWNHPDLNDNVWINTLEIAGNGIDDDGNGFVDDVRGWDWWSNDNDPADQNNHGTHTSGTVGAEGNNGTGVVGVNWNVKLMGLKIGGAGSSVSGAAAVSAMNYVLAMKNRANSPVNVRVTNHSWGGGGFDNAMNNAVANHAANGILMVCAAGNFGSNNDSSPFYPATYNQPNIISVGNLTRFNARNTGSNYGANTVDLFAPGTDVLSTIRTAGGSYASFTGTSMAAPHVAGVAALLWAVAPGATYQVVRDAIFQSVDPVTSLTSFCVTGGRLNARAALASIAAIPAVPAQPDLSSSSDLGQFNNDNITADNTPTFLGSGATAGNTILIFANGTQVGSGVVAANGSWSVTTSALADGVRQITARQQSASGTSGDSPALAVTIDTVVPVISNPLFTYFQSPHSVRLSVSENVSWSVAANDFDVQNLTSPGNVNVSPVFDTGTNFLTVSFPTVPILSDGNYRLTVLDTGPGNGLQDVAGNVIAQYVHNFFFLMGDANRDARVNLEDFNILAANFGQSFREWGQGDFTYDGTVNLADFNLLASRFGVSLAAPGVTDRSGTGTSESRFGSTRIGETETDDALDEMLA